MPKAGNPRHGSMQYWPRKRARKEIARLRYMHATKDSKILGFAGYKAGMTHVIFKDNRKASATKNQDISCPVTIIECPPLKVFSARFYRHTPYGLHLCSQIVADSFDKHLSKTIPLPKNKAKKTFDEQYSQLPHFDEIRLLCHTQPGLTGIGKKKPEMFELWLHGAKEEKTKFAKEKLGKEISVEEVFKEGQQVDVHAVTKGKGFQGPVKRFGVTLRSHKSEKTKRGPANLSGWKAQGHTQYRVAHAGQMGYQTRTEYNKWVLKISKHPEDIKVKGGFIRYGFVKNPYLLVKGSISGPKKRLIRLTHAMRSNTSIPSAPPEISYLSLASKQG